MSQNKKRLKYSYKKKRDLIIEKGILPKLVGRLNTHKKNSKSSDILKQKNTKYLCKAFLINSLRNGFSFKDINNRNITLTDFKGKYMCTDVQATWCKSIDVLQLYSGSNRVFVKFYDIRELPRFMFLDKKDRIISSDEIRPSNSKALEKLKSTVYSDEYKNS